MISKAFWVSSIDGLSNFSEEAKTVTYVYVAEEGAPVTVEHVDENGDSLLSSEILTGKIGSEYTSDAKEIEGYTLKETPSNATGTFTDKEQTITYVYEVAQGADVKVEYVDEDGKELVDSETLTGKIGAEYMTEAKEVEGYSLKETPSNATGTFAKEAQTVKYVYEVTEGAPITVRYVDENGEDLLQPLTVTGKIGEKYTSEAKNIADYRFKEVPSNGTVTFSKEEQTVTYVYEVRPWDEMSFITDTVTYEVGTEIDSAEIISQIRPEAVARDMFGNIVSDTANQKYFHADLSEVNMNQPGVYTVRITNDRNGDHDNFYGPSTTPYDMYVKAEGYITINVEAEDAEEDREEVETYNQFKLGYWRGFGFVLEGAAGLDGVTFDTKESVKKTVEIVNGDDEVVQSIAAVNTNWYDSSNYDGYQAILTADILGSLAEGSYRMQVRIEVDGEEYVSTITEQLASTRGILSGEYQNSIANIETRYAHGNQIQFGNVMNQMVLSVTSQAGEWNTLVDYRLSDGTRVIDAWIATDFDYSQEHTKELVVRDKENNEVERTKASTWNIREVFNVPVKAEWERAGVQVLIAPEYQTNDYTCYVVVSDASGEEVIEVEIAL